MNTRRLPLIVALVLAVGTGVLMINYLASLQAQSSDNHPRKVVVAARDIQARVPITGDMLAYAERPASQVDSDALSDKETATNSIALITIPAGSTVTSSKVGQVSVLALPRRLTLGLRAVSISIDRVKGVSGLIEPGDRVDVIAVPPRVGNETPRATTILRGVLVLAMGGQTESARATPSPDNQNTTTVTLAVTPKQADLLALADVNTTLRLALRPPQEPVRAYPAEPLQLGISAPQPVVAAVAPAAAAPAAPPAAPAAVMQPAPRPKSHNADGAVQVYDGDHLVANTSEHQ